MSAIINLFVSLLANKELIFAVISSLVEIVNLVTKKWSKIPVAA